MNETVLKLLVDEGNMIKWGLLTASGGSHTLSSAHGSACVTEFVEFVEVDEALHACLGRAALGLSFF